MVDKHKIQVGQAKYGTLTLSVEDGDVQAEFESENDEYLGTARCICGEKFWDVSRAEEHLMEEAGVALDV